MWYHFTSSRSSRQNKIKKGSRHHFDIIRWSNYQLSKSPMTRISPLYVSVQILGMTFNWQLSMSSVLLFLMDLVDSYIYIPPLKFLWLFYSTKLLLLISNVIVQYERQHEKEPVLNGFGTKKCRCSNKIWLKLFISMPGKMRTVQWTADEKKMSGAKYILVYSLVSKWGQCTFSLFSFFWHYTVRNMYLYLIDTAIYI